MAQGIRLTELIETLRQDLLEYDRTKGPSYKPLFRIKGAVVEAELEAVSTKETTIKGSGGITWFVVKAGASRSSRAKCNCKISITLESLGKKVAGKKTSRVLTAGSSKKKTLRRS